MSRLPLATFVLLAVAAPLAADPYRLSVGDKVILDYDFLEDPKTAVVDLDGNIRLSELGSIVARDRTLDEIEQSITEGMIEGGFSGVSFVSVEMSDYAPVVVSGFVERSGRYDYLPGMTVGAAIALAGGLGSGDAEGPNVDVLAINARRRAATAAESIAAAVADMARLEATLDGDDAVIALDETRSRSVPTELRAGMAGRIATESRQLASTRARTETLLASWAREIADFEAQTALLDARIILKEETVANLAQELADLDNLRSQGLTTTARFSTLQQRLADDREELLTLETAKIAARRAASLAARNRDQFIADGRMDALEDLEIAQASFEAGLRDYRFALNELTVLSDDTEALSSDLPVFDLRFVLQGPRGGRLDLVDRDTPMLPGDILVVEVLDGL
ncbi:MAG: polysaccharide biosynthesis/export family protein [Jannaschia sp.]